jgi:hypothetical protein
MTYLNASPVSLVTAAISLFCFIHLEPSGEWGRKADMPTPRLGQSLYAVEGKIYYIGGVFTLKPPHPAVNWVEEFSCMPSEDPKDTNSHSEEGHLMGTWQYISLSGRNTAGDVIYPYGEHLYGMLMYDPGGNMSALLMNPDRPRFLSGDMMNGTPDELEAAFEGFDAYCGTYTLDEQNATITHHVKGAKFPNWVGTDQVRFYEISGDTLRISAPPIMAHGDEWIFEAVLVKL